MAGAMLAFSGKGGSGKTTLSSMVVRELIRTGRKPVLAVDADSNATLAMALGVECPETISDLRERMGEAAQSPTEVPKDRLMDQWLAELLVEHEGFDLLAMGRPEGPRCYCYVNGLLRRYLKLLRDNYPYVVIDCEAGMEFLSRLVVDDVDALVLVAEATPVGLTTAQRIRGLVNSLPMQVHRQVLALNKVRPGAAAETPPELADMQAVVRVPLDEDLAGRSARGAAIDDNVGPEARAAIEELTNHCVAPRPQAEARPDTTTR